MGEMARQTEEQLERLITLVPGAKLHRLSRKGGAPRKEILPAGIDMAEDEDDGHRPLPAMAVVFDGRKVNLEFSPARDPDTYWMNLYVSGNCPIGVTVTAVTTEGFVRSGPMALQSFKTGDEKFDSLYDVMSTSTDEARRLLEDAENRQRILAMGEIERLTLETRFLRLIRLVDEFSDIEAEGLRRTIQEMAQLATHLEEPARARG